MTTLTFVYLPTFLRTAKGLLSDEDERAMELQLLQDPERGDVIAKTGGFRKMRLAGAGRGKRGGNRVIYFYVRPDARVYLALAYAKNVADDLTEAEKRTLKQLAATLG